MVAVDGLGQVTEEEALREEKEEKGKSWQPQQVTGLQPGWNLHRAGESCAREAAVAKGVVAWGKVQFFLRREVRR